VFLDGTNKNYERWKPYRRWAASLRPERDRVITSNYDLVPDALLGDMTAKLLLPSEAIPGTDYRRVPLGTPTLSEAFYFRAHAGENEMSSSMPSALETFSIVLSVGFSSGFSSFAICC
jgi:hypothetical protein